MEKVDYGKAPETYVIGCYPAFRKKAAYIIELHYGYGLSAKEIITDYDVTKSSVYRALRLYKPKKGSRNIAIAIMSKI